MMRSVAVAHLVVVWMLLLSPTVVEAARWKNRTMNIVTLMGPEQDAPLAAAVQSWSGGVLKLRIAPGPAYVPVYLDCPYAEDTITVCIGNLGPTGWAGASRPVIQNGIIVEASVTVNTYYGGAAQKWLCHELGEAFGLSESDDPLSCTHTPTTSLTPAASDFPRLRDLYTGSK